MRLGESWFAHALKDNRATSMAAGVLMERQRVDRCQAFEMLRSRARAERRKVGEYDERGDLLEAANWVLTNLGGWQRLGA